LHADTVLTGNYLREGIDLRVTVQLIDVKTQTLLWKGAFDLQYDRVITVQDRLAQQVVKGLQLSLSSVRTKACGPKNRSIRALTNITCAVATSIPERVHACCGDAA
jgi:hypothetical protein